MKKRNCVVSGVIVLAMSLTLSIGAYAFADSSDEAKTVNNGDKTRSFLQLTNEQLTAIKEARISNLKEAVSNLTEEGIFTKEEAEDLLTVADKVPSNSELPVNRDEHKGLSEKGNGMFRNMTEEQREVLNSEMQSIYEAALSELVADGTITQVNADELNEFNHNLKSNTDLTEEQRAAIRNIRTSSMKEAVASLVEKGELTQEDSDTTLAEVDKEPVNSETKVGINRNNEHKSFSNKENYEFKNLTEEQKEALNSEMQSLYEVSLSELVTDGTITQEIADELQHMPMGMRFGMKK